MRAIHITPANQMRLSEEFEHAQFDLEAMLPPEMILVTGFGDPIDYDLESEESFEFNYVVGSKLEDGWFEVMSKEFKFPLVKEI